MSGSKKLILITGAVVALAAVYLLAFGLPGSGSSAPKGGPPRVARGTDANAPDEGTDPTPAAGGDPEETRSSTATYRDVVKIAQRQDPKYLPQLREAAEDKDWRKRHAAVTGIGQLKDKGDPKLLLSVLTDTSQRPEVRAAAAEGLGAMGYYEAGPALIQAMDDDAGVVRAAAGVALRRIMKVHYGYRANDPPEKRRQTLALIRSEWQKFYEFIRNREK